MLKTLPEMIDTPWQNVSRCHPGNLPRRIHPAIPGQGRIDCLRDGSHRDETFSQEDLPSLIGRLKSIWQALLKKGEDRDRLIAQSMLSPATCCLVNPDKEKTVARAFAKVNQMSRQMRDAHRLG